MLNSTAIFTAFWFRPEIWFLASFNPNTENCLYKVKFCNLTNSMTIFILFYQKNCAMADLDKKIKVVCLSQYFGTDLLDLLVKFTFPVL